MIVVRNPESAKLMGGESQGMLVAATDRYGTLSVIVVDGEVTEGSVVK